MRELCALSGRSGSRRAGSQWSVGLLHQASAPKGVEGARQTKISLVICMAATADGSCGGGCICAYSAQPPSVQEFAWLHDRPPCRNSLTGSQGVE